MKLRVNNTFIQLSRPPLIWFHTYVIEQYLMQSITSEMRAIAGVSKGSLSSPLHSATTPASKLCAKLLQWKSFSISSKNDQNQRFLEFLFYLLACQPVQNRMFSLDKIQVFHYLLGQLYIFFQQLPKVFFSLFCFALFHRAVHLATTGGATTCHPIC